MKNKQSGLFLWITVSHEKPDFMEISQKYLNSFKTVYI